MNVWLKRRKEREIKRHADPKTIAEIIVENQSLYSKLCDDQADLINIARKVYDPSFLTWKMISIQPMLGPNDIVKVLKFQYTGKPHDLMPDCPEITLAVEDHELSAKSTRLKTEQGLSEEETVKSIQEEIFREITTDLRNNVGTIATWDASEALGEDRTLKERYESLWCKIAELTGIIHRKTMRDGANWMVMNAKTAVPFDASCTHCFMDTANLYPGKGIYYLGRICGRWQLIIDTEYPDNEILLGYKGDSNLDAGYFYCPYLMTRGSILLSDDSPRPGQSYLNRHGKKMPKEGCKFYARLKIVNQAT